MGAVFADRLREVQLQIVNHATTVGLHSPAPISSVKDL
jgi:hypothetical protein